MTTAFQTGPGFFAADTSEHDKTLPANTMRVYCARIEAYDLPLHDKAALDTQFTILAAQGENDPRVAKALLKLGEHIKGNKTTLEEFARA